MIGNIHSIDTMGLVDGPGIRVVVFLQGCGLRCKFCHNPETWNDQQKQKTYTPEELVKFILNYKEYFKKKGGVTFSGGEPLRQPKFLLECLKLCKENGIHTCLDTAGYASDYDEILDYTDLVLFDIKEIDKDRYQQLTGRPIELSLKFLKTCQEKNKKMWIRQVIIPGYNDNVSYIHELKEFVKNLKNIEKIELLSYHTMGLEKYRMLNIPYSLENVPDMDKEECKKLEELLKER